MGKEWYILEYENKTYLHGKSLIFQPFLSSRSDHSHCELCWARFSEYLSDLHCGYYEPDSKSWICIECFNDFAKLFDWTVIEEE